MKSSIILAAGLGKRVREYSLDLPKPLIEVNGKPFIEYSINIMEELGFEEIIINVHYKSDQIISYLTNLNNPKIKIYPKDSGSKKEKIIQACKEFRDQNIKVIIGPTDSEFFKELDNFNDLIFIYLYNL